MASSASDTERKLLLDKAQKRSNKHTVSIQARFPNMHFRSANHMLPRAVTLLRRVMRLILLNSKAVALVDGVLKKGDIFVKFCPQKDILANARWNWDTRKISIASHVCTIRELLSCLMSSLCYANNDAFRDLEDEFENVEKFVHKKLALQHASENQYANIMMFGEENCGWPKNHLSGPCYVANSLEEFLEKAKQPCLEHNGFSLAECYTLEAVNASLSLLKDRYPDEKLDRMQPSEVADLLVRKSVLHQKKLMLTQTVIKRSLVAKETSVPFTPLYHQSKDDLTKPLLEPRKKRSQYLSLSSFVD